ncbi:MAG: CoA pyrophosphatase [Anaerovorax sp.]
MNLDEIEKIFLNRKPKNLGSYQYFSVFVPLVEKEGQIHILYEVRAEQLKTQPGEVCFPGGKVEPKESSLQCAIRETSEELGVEKNQVKIISRLDHMHTYSNFTMYSYLGVLDYQVLKKAKFNEDEVKEIFLVPLSFLLENEPYIYNFDVVPKVGDDFPYEMINSKKGYNWRKGESIVTIYRYGEHVIWGLTGRITYNLMNILKVNKG